LQKAEKQEQTKNEEIKWSDVENCYDEAEKANKMRRN
jgi:hypothetical protein